MNPPHASRRRDVVTQWTPPLGRAKARQKRNWMRDLRAAIDRGYRYFWSRPHRAQVPLTHAMRHP